jgi:hypothetical protein
MSWVAVAIGGSALLSTAVGVYSANKAADAQMAGMDSAAQAQLIAQREAIASNEKMLERQIELNEPFREAGVQALKRYSAEVTQGAPTFDEFIQSPEAAKIRMQELKDITKATERSAAARGNLFAPSTQEALQDRALQKTASSKLGQYEMSLQRRQADIDNLGNIVNVGRGATMSNVQAIGQAGGSNANIITNTGNNLANLNAAAGEARASGYINTSNAITSGVTSLASNYILSSLIKDPVKQTPVGP